MHSAGLRSASRSRSACGRAGSATAAAMGLGMAGDLAEPTVANVAKPMAAASIAVDPCRNKLVMMIPRSVDFGRLSPRQGTETGDRVDLFQARLAIGEGIASDGEPHGVLRIGWLHAHQQSVPLRTMRRQKIEVSARHVQGDAGAVASSGRRQDLATLEYRVCECADRGVGGMTLFVHHLEIGHDTLAARDPG